jgi:two-component system chemotaxis sensor kinase CheA
MDMSPYRDLFVSEARNHLSAFNGLIVHLEETPDDPAAVNELFRHAHSMKGMASTMGYDQVVGISHIMESQLSRIRSGEFRMQPICFWKAATRWTAWCQKSSPERTATKTPPDWLND